MKKRKVKIRHSDISREARKHDGYNPFFCAKVYECKCEHCFIMNCSHRMKLLVVNGVVCDI